LWVRNIGDRRETKRIIQQISRRIIERLNRRSAAAAFSVPGDVGT
jgi:hypothetical protein